MTTDDADAVLSIYGQGIATGNATFVAAVPTWADWDRAHHPYARRVATTADGTVLGWCAIAPTSARAAYRGVAEVSVYVAEQGRGRGVGQALLSELVMESEANGIWTLQAGIFPENEASIAIHLKAGFRIVGRRERVGMLGSRWRDVMLLERRSTVIGSE